MATYTKFNKKDIQSLADNYDLKIVEFSALDDGNGNTSYILKTKQSSYVLTVCDNKELDEVYKNGAVVVAARKAQCPTSPCLRSIRSQVRILSGVLEYNTTFLCQEASNFGASSFLILSHTYSNIYQMKDTFLKDTKFQLKFTN